MYSLLLVHVLTVNIVISAIRMRTFTYVCKFYIYVDFTHLCKSAHCHVNVNTHLSKFTRV